MTREEIDFIGSMNMCDEISNEAYKKIMCHCEEQEACKDAVSREDLIVEISENHQGFFFKDEKYGKVGILFENLMPIIYGMPSVAPKHKTGHWISLNNILNVGKRVKCSECGQVYIVGDKVCRNYCANCGAKMAESEE